MASSATVTISKMTSPLRALCQHGGEALKPQLVNSKWRRPAVSKRVAARIRKQAVIEGTFGSFDPGTGKGWDPSWDTVGRTGTMQLRPPKGTKRERTREARARKIDNLMEGMDQKIDDYYKAKHDKKPEKTFETTFKQLSGGGKKK